MQSLLPYTGLTTEIWSEIWLQQTDRDELLSKFSINIQNKMFYMCVIIGDNASSTAQFNILEIYLPLQIMITKHFLYAILKNKY